MAFDRFGRGSGLSLKRSIAKLLFRHAVESTKPKALYAIKGRAADVKETNLISKTSINWFSSPSSPQKRPSVHSKNTTGAALLCVCWGSIHSFLEICQNMEWGRLLLEAS